MAKSSNVRSVETLSCDAGWRNYHFVKIMTEDGIVVGNPADLVVLDTNSGPNAIAELPDVLAGFKQGRQVFERRPPVLFKPA